MRGRIVLLARVPRAGAVKTRLAAAIGDRPALLLYRAFVVDQLRFLGSFAAEYDLEWCVDGEPPPDLARLAEEERVGLSRQVGGDLGARIAAVLEHTRATVVVGADSPTLPSRLVRDSLDRVAAFDGAVVVPAEDGGYVLVGLSRPAPALFCNIPWSGTDVLERTRERAREAGVELAEIGRWYDVDDRGGLARLIDELADPAQARRAPATARTILDLSLSRMV